MTKDPDFVSGEGLEQEIKIPLNILFEILETLRLAAIYLDPPEDFKPWKFDPPEEAAKDITIKYRSLLNEMADKMGVDISGKSS